MTEVRKPLPEEVVAELVAVVSSILLRHDPARVDFGSNPDEYDAEAEDLIARLQDNREALFTDAICRQVMERWFGPEVIAPDADFQALAEDVDEAWARFT